MIQEIAIQNYLPHLGTENVLEEIMTGLNSPQKYIPPKFFYDEKGSELFEEITKLDDYYPTRTEKQIISNLFNLIQLNLPHLNIVELGSGDPSKITLLLEQIPEDLLSTINYYPVDICEAEIIKSVNELSRYFSLHTITGIVADFHHQLHVIPKKGCRLFCFFGSTLGNFTFDEAENFIKKLAAEMRPGDRLLLGVDMVKDIPVIERAYNDSEGITAQFNLNILNAVNNLIGSDFRPEDFEHMAFFNPNENRIEMHLRACKDVDIHIGNNNYKDRIRIRKDETIHTEYSHKFTYDKIRQLCQWGDFEQYTVCHGQKGWFSMIYALK